MIVPVYSAILLAPGPGGPVRWRELIIFGLSCIANDLLGTAVNDVADRKIDVHVSRTASRPLATGELRLTQAFACIAVLAVVNVLLLAPLGLTPALLLLVCWLLAVAYPFMKRSMGFPQGWLAFTYNSGVVVAWVTIAGGIHPTAFLLYVAAAAWTIAYDTIYAHQDAVDDVRVGVKSSALLFGSATPRWLAGCFAMNLALVAAVGVVNGLGWPFYVVLLVAAGHAGWQIRTIDLTSPEDCDRKFRSNQVYGVLLLTALVVGQLTA